MKGFCQSIALAVCISPSFASAYDDLAIVAQCDAEWATDFSMVAFCREQQRDAGEKVDSLRARAGSDGNLETILDGCEGEWRSDYSMVAFCVDQQSSALESLGIAASDIPQGINQIIRAQCETEWGTDFSMIAFCVDQQSAAWRSLN